MVPIVIAVDGYAATGKSTTARLVADKLGYTFIDTGAMYRAVTLYMVENGVSLNPDLPVFTSALEAISLDFRYNPETQRRDMCLNGRNVEQEIREMDVNAQVSEVAAISEVRRRLVAIQQEMGSKGGVVMDGRDIGTVVFPNAELKVFLTASLEVRIERRMAQLEKKGKRAVQEEVRDNLIHRDYIDSTRKDSPLRMAEDAVEIDTTHLAIPEQVDLVVQYAQKLLARELSGS